MALTVAYWRERIRKINLSMARAVAAKNTKGEIRWLGLLADATTSLRTLLDPPEPEEEAEIAVIAPDAPVPTKVLTYDEEHEIFLAAEDLVLKALGRPYGHEGAERGALPLAKHIEMADTLGLPLHAAEWRTQLAIVDGTSQ